jgi:hypothetical protein
MSRTLSVYELLTVSNANKYSSHVHNLIPWVMDAKSYLTNPNFSFLFLIYFVLIIRSIMASPQNIDLHLNSCLYTQKVFYEELFCI